MEAVRVYLVAGFIEVVGWVDGGRWSAYLPPCISSTWDLAVRWPSLCAAVSRWDCARSPSCRTPPCMPYNDWQQLVVWLQLIVICPTTVYSWSVTDYSWYFTDNSWLLTSNSWLLTDYSWLLTDYSWSSERSWWKQATDCCWVGWNRGQEKIGTSGTRCCHLKTGLRASYVTRQQQA